MSKKKKYIVGNWKMNPQSQNEALSIFQKINRGIKVSKNVEPVLCPPFVFLSPLVQKKTKKIKFGGQNLFYEPKGSFTGEVSAGMLASAGATYVIIGHSERRKLGETNEIVNKKVVAALAAGLRPIMCIGEQSRDEDGAYFTFLKEQIEMGLLGVSQKDISKILIAYEPIYAIGASKALSAYDVHQMTIFIKKTMIEVVKSRDVSVTILYGGSVDTSNAADLLAHSEADGFLIGRQSLDPASFLEILNTARGIK